MTAKNRATKNRAILSLPFPTIFRILCASAALLGLVACGGGSGDASSQNLATDPAPALPGLTFGANPTAVSDGQSSTLNWSATNADACTASGDWSGIKGVSGNFNTGPLSADATYTLNCSGDGGGVMASVTVVVDTNAANATSVQLSAADAGVALNGTTTLTWSSQNATDCSASGGWSGTKALSGSEPTIPISADTTFQLNCNGPQGNALAITTVSVRVASLAWDVPTQNTDGSTLTDLASYKLYWGTQSRQYPDSLPIGDPATTETVLELAPGTYYFAITALNTAGVESSYSNELSKVIL